MDKKQESLTIWTVIGVIAAVAAVVASVTTAMIIIKKKEKEKVDQEIQDYLDYSIQYFFHNRGAQGSGCILKIEKKFRKSEPNGGILSHQSDGFPPFIVSLARTFDVLRKVC